MIMQRVAPLLLGIVMVSNLACSCLIGGSDQDKEYLVEEDLTYGKGNDVDLKLNLARPSRGKGPFPALVFLFGGGYKVGSKRNWDFVIREAAKRGYVAIAIDYRLTDVMQDGQVKYSFPAQIHDGKCAVRWLRANANRYGIDPDRIGAVGFSAGGNLSLMLGLTGPSNGLEGECGDLRFSSRIQAVVNMAGGTDLLYHYHIYPYDYGDLLGGTPEEFPERYRAASPLTYVSDDDPPVMTLVGTDDPVFRQEKLLDERMRIAGVPHALIVREGVGHTRSELANLSEDNLVWLFLDEHLKKGGK